MSANTTHAASRRRIGCEAANFARAWMLSRNHTSMSFRELFTLALAPGNPTSAGTAPPSSCRHRPLIIMLPLCTPLTHDDQAAMKTASGVAVGRQVAVWRVRGASPGATSRDEHHHGPSRTCGCRRPATAIKGVAGSLIQSRPAWDFRRVPNPANPPEWSGSQVKLDQNLIMRKEMIHLVKHHSGLTWLRRTARGALLRGSDRPAAVQF